MMKNLKSLMEAAGDSFRAQVDPAWTAVCRDGDTVLVLSLREILGSGRAAVRAVRSHQTSDVSGAA